MRAQVDLRCREKKETAYLLSCSLVLTHPDHHRGNNENHAREREEKGKV